MNKETMLLHIKIADRAQRMGLLVFDKMSLLMDLEAAQIGFNLDCENLLAADDFNFAHDINGIQRHINRKATCLYSKPQRAVFENCFLPRFARPIEDDEPGIGCCERYPNCDCYHEETNNEKN